MRRQVVADCLQAIAAIEKDVKQRFKGEPRVEALKEIYGIGIITAASLVVAIDDISRFPTSRKLCAWAGLIPSRHNSGPHVRLGHITKQGPPNVRWLLI